MHGLISTARTSEAGRVAREKFTELIEHGRKRGKEVLEHVAAMQPRDRLIPAPELRFIVDASTPHRISIASVGATPHEPIVLHPHALGQVADKAGMPRSYLTHLMEPKNVAWGPQLAALNFDQLFAAGRNDNATTPDDDNTGAFLVRSVPIAETQREEARGFLSSRFKRLDSRPIVAAFASACEKVGALPVEGHVTDTRVAIKVVLAKLFEPVPNEILAFGMLFENSDFGNGALSLSLFALRLICTNGMVMERSLRKVHLGSRLTAGVAWSATTLAAETGATASAVHDLARSRLNERSVQHLIEGIRLAHAETVTPKAANEYLRKHLLKAEIETVTAAFNSPDIEMMPAGQTKWRLSNAISWVAGKAEDVDRRLVMERAAGALLPVNEAA